jgi:hypothetical protein
MEDDITVLEDWDSIVYCVHVLFMHVLYSFYACFNAK